MTIGISPSTPAVNPKTQCTREGCGTMLLTDGTCPRCDPPMRRTTDEKLRLAKEFGDSRLLRTAEREIDAGIATQGPGGPPSSSLATSADLDHVHDRIDSLQRMVASLSAQIDELRATSHDHAPEPPAA